MKRFATLSLLALALGSQAVYAAEKRASTKSFWQELRLKIESMTPQKKMVATTATGGVRGAPVSTEDVYWKNEATGQTVASEEMESFKKAVKLADSDNSAKAQDAFAEFVRQYPGSPLRKDADEALALLGGKRGPAK